MAVVVVGAVAFFALNPSSEPQYVISTPDQAGGHPKVSATSAGAPLPQGNGDALKTIQGVETVVSATYKVDGGKVMFFGASGKLPSSVKNAPPPRSAGSIKVTKIDVGGTGTGQCLTVTIPTSKIPAIGCSWRTDSTLGELHAIPDVDAAMLSGRRPTGIPVEKLAAYLREMRPDLEQEK